jgi:mannosyltransferase OCH1-like enzyme
MSARIPRTVRCKTALTERRYLWFLETFDSYPYPIQRADAIRYFVLHHFGGIYIDLDDVCTV